MAHVFAFHALWQAWEDAYIRTLSGRTHLTLVRRLKERGYGIRIFFLWVTSLETTLSRISDRVRRGGHDVPEPVVRRRFERSIRNFLLILPPARGLLDDLR